MVTVDKVQHFYGKGKLRRQVLHEVSLQLEQSQIVILSGPSGCGKTTLLTLIGGLRSVQQGSLTVLGQQLKGASGWKNTGSCDTPVFDTCRRKKAEKMLLLQLFSAFLFC